MARKFLVPVDLDKNSLFNAALHPSGTAPSSPVEGQAWYDSTNNQLKVYNGASWDTLSTSTGTISSVVGTTNEVTASTASGTVTVGLPDSVTITTDLSVGGNATITGNLTVNGTTTTLNTTELTISDNSVYLNSDFTGASPTENGTFGVNRGDQPWAQIVWNESTDAWQIGTVGSMSAISTAAHNHTVDSLSNVVITSNSDNEVLAWDSATSKWINQTAAEAGLAAATHTHAQSDITNLTTDLAAKAPLASPTFTGTVTLPSTTSIGTITSTELSYVDGVTSSIQTQLNGKAATSHTHTVSNITDLTATAAELNTLDGITATVTELNYTDGVTSNIQTQLDARTRKYAVGNSAITPSSGIATWVVNHALATRDVQVRMYLNSGTYEDVEVDVERTDDNNVTLKWSASASVTANTYRVVVIG